VPFGSRAWAEGAVASVEADRDRAQVSEILAERVRDCEIRLPIAVEITYCDPIGILRGRVLPGGGEGWPCEARCRIRREADGQCDAEAGGQRESEEPHLRGPRLTTRFTREPGGSTAPKTGFSLITDPAGLQSE
jgi:hypothetical protein